MSSVSSISVHAMPYCSNNSRNAFTYLSVVNFCVNVSQNFSFTQFTSTSMGVDPHRCSNFGYVVPKNPDRTFLYNRCQPLNVAC